MEALATVEDLEWIAVEDVSAAGRVRRSTMKLAERLGFPEHRVGEVGIAATELATNLARHAVAGSALVRVRRCGDDGAVQLVVLDAGPGIADFADVASDGRSSAGTLGIGLGAAMRLATWFDSYSLPKRGTAIVATFWRASPPIPKPAIATVTRPMSGETECGDACAVLAGDQIATVMLVDGLGHGALAASAAHQAVRVFEGGTNRDGLCDTLERIHAALRKTRGAAVALARLDYARAKVSFAGVGNVAGWIDDGTQRHALASSPGIVGANAQRMRQFDLDLPEGALVVLHSDGLTAKWDLGKYPGLRTRDPHVVAATLLRDAGVRHDDASIIVARAP